MPPLVQEELGQLQITFVTRNVVELHQANFDLLMPGHVAPLARPEDTFDQVGVLERNIEQRALARGLEMRHSRLVQVPDVV